MRERAILVIRARDVADDDIVKVSVVCSRDKPANLVVENTELLVLWHHVYQQGPPQN